VPGLKISLITVCYNAEAHIGRCIASVIAQNYPNLEYIIIDGGSDDNTLAIINSYEQNEQCITVVVSEPDKGVYDAMNKGIQRATGEVLGTLNADDFFASENVLTTIGNVFAHNDIDILYGDLDYVDFNETIIRRWRTKSYIKGVFNWGWMPPHPTFYCKRSLFEKYGLYKLDYGTAADYELMLRFMHPTNANTFYLQKVLVKMQVGGLSNRSFQSRLKAWANDLKAMRKNGIMFPLLTLIMKPLRKIRQFLQ
jgi:glycosyltransferase involved in cell wall biosynthesis